MDFKLILMKAQSITIVLYRCSGVPSLSLSLSLKKKKKTTIAKLFIIDSNETTSMLHYLKSKFLKKQKTLNQVT